MRHNFETLEHNKLKICTLHVSFVISKRFETKVCSFDLEINNRFYVNYKNEQAHKTPYKFFHNGSIYIRRSENLYTLLGAKIE